MFEALFHAFMKRIESGRLLEKALLIIAFLLASLIVIALISRRSSATIAPTDFTIAFVFTENAALASNNYRWMLLVIVVVLILLMSSIVFKYSRAHFVSSLKPQFGFYVIVTAMVIVMSGIGLKVYSDDYAYQANSCALLQNTYDSGQYRIAEGKVHVLHTQPAGGHQKGDIIQVGAIEFEVDAFEETCGYKTTIAYGGVLTEGRYAKVYYAFGDTILRVDVKKQ